ncbi:TPA: hypothetical protein P7Z02_004495 [Citrobacter koseri]|nr:hypothetical protein [Citrobacter koseri]HDQ2587352.1 hypothetical protein [Citrobacter koseri]
MQEFHNELDLIEIVYFLLDKWKSIFVTVIIFVAGSFSFLYLYRDIVNVSVKVMANLETPSTYSLCGNMDVDCKSNIITNVFGDFLPAKYKDSIAFNKKEYSFEIKKTINVSEVEKFVLQMNSATEKMRIWYVKDGELELCKQHAGFLITETCAKLFLISNVIKKNNNIENMHVNITPKYNNKIVLTIACLLGGIISILFHLVLRAFLTYRNENMKFLKKP